MKQTFTDFELLIIDDGSVDNTREVVSKIDDVRIKYIYQENSGVSGRRNKGILKSSGNLIFFVDSDDYLGNNCLELLYTEFNKYNEPDLTTCEILDYSHGEKAKLFIGKDSLQFGTGEELGKLITYIRSGAQPVSYLGKDKFLVDWNIFHNTSMSIGEDLTFVHEYL